jgi:predicted nucleic acid-binding protein
VSTALALEYEEVLGRAFGPKRQPTVMAALQALLSRAEFVPIFYTVRPWSPDPDDDLVIDCAFNAGAPIVTSNTRDFRGLEAALGVAVLTPREFASVLRSP